MSVATLDAWLNSYCSNADSQRQAVAQTVRQLVSAALNVRKAIGEGALGIAFGGTRGNANSDGDIQKDLDVHADEIFLAAMRDAPIAYYASEELHDPVELDRSKPLALAIDPLDGSSNIDTNVSIGTIFSILPAHETVAETFLQSGRTQIGAGFFIFGPQFALVISLGKGTSIFVFSARIGTFLQAYESLNITEDAKEFAVNTSNYRHWDEAVRLYIDDCLQGTDGPRGKDFNMRWIASLVADTYRILVRGGVFLYPPDSRKGYRNGRLRLVYEANPIAMLIEGAGGMATNCVMPILDLIPTDIHQRTELVFGSAREVEKITRYHIEPSAIGSRHPLFGNRSLFRP
ncbi:class 1 fructose-bisphosphatase [Rhizobium giardinii]|uniref:class 1 fructose-bisphosphatase n=1 Tax=Rhizobium giardinii TaxID=56731 RepID=UPI000362B264|nr:class 1 fructose-bisphosphatase [Rhizobium giardinii]